MVFHTKGKLTVMSSAPSVITLTQSSQEPKTVFIVAKPQEVEESKPTAVAQRPAIPVPPKPVPVVQKAVVTPPPPKATVSLAEKAQKPVAAPKKEKVQKPPAIKKAQSARWSDDVDVEIAPLAPQAVAAPAVVTVARPTPPEAHTTEPSGGIPARPAGSPVPVRSKKRFVQRRRR